jgi:protein TonB
VHVKRSKTIGMKREKSRVPKFDEIIFENRNKEYGAFDLRKRYKSVTSLSILIAVTLSVTLVTVSFKTTEAPSGSQIQATSVVAVIDDYDPTLIKVQPEIKPPGLLAEAPRNVAPVIVTDTALATNFIPIMEDLIRTITNGDVNDTVARVVVITEEIGEPSEPEPFFVVEEMPEFPGGNKALLEYISNNLVYPGEALENSIQGRVILQFIVREDGSVGRIELLKGVDPLLDQEAMRVISSLPRLKPGKQNGVPVPVWFSVPVNFQLIY